NAQVINDNCSNATALQINQDLQTTLKTSGTVTGATASAEPNTCSGYADDDVWFQFVATSTVHRINLINVTGATPNLNHVVYEGTCSSHNEVHCDIKASETNIIENLTEDDTYFIRASSWLGASEAPSSFSISVSNLSPANDDCSNAITLIPSVTAYCTNTTF